jgi:hypothetical protein
MPLDFEKKYKKASEIKKSIQKGVEIENVWDEQIEEKRAERINQALYKHHECVE